MKSTTVLAIFWGLSALAGVVQAADTLPTEISFNRDIRPILSDNCFACHGPDKKARKADLRLDTREGATEVHDGVAAIVPGHTNRSELLNRIVSHDPDEVMPPPKSERKLGGRQIALFKRWVEQGAKWESHWSLIAPKRPELPAVSNESWCRTPIDRFILACLDREKLRPTAEADRATLIRRVTYDLTGLPPTLQEVDAFLTDPAPDAYERVVDRLLASPRYGEKLALHWLDLARYADTHGYHLDAGRDMSLWRDWVINAFNRNLPYDKFVLWQLAGDLLPNATAEQKIATGFCRNNMINFEGGADPQEYHTQYVLDRVNTFGTAFLGLTVGCAQCHDHKFDPISQKEYYQLYAYFNAVPEKGLDGRNGNAEPLMAMPTPEQQAAIDRLKARISEREKEQAKAAAEADNAQREWELANAAAQPQDSVKWSVLTPENVHSFNGATMAILRDNSVLATGQNPATDVIEVIARTDRTGITALRLAALTDQTLYGDGPGRASNGNFVLTEIEVEATSIADKSKTQRIRLNSADADYSQENYDITKAIDGNPRTGWAVDGNVKHEQRIAWFAAAEPFGYEGGTELRVRMHFESMSNAHVIGRARFAITSDPAAAKIGKMPLLVRTILERPEGERTKKQQDQLREFYRKQFWPALVQADGEIVRMRKELEGAKKQVPNVMVMAEMEKPRETYVLNRGQFNQPGDKVEPGVPASLPPLPAGAPKNRLALAQWITDPQHPLLARVTVNRFWKLAMGGGLVKTLNDFGSQAEWPSHPELLDWLATEFTESEWDVKHMLRLVVTSATYRQSAKVTQEHLERDPNNRFYARAPRFRLSAEEIRDTALAVSGLMNPKIGGPSVSPYQPAGLWEELSSRKDSANWSAQTFVQSHGADLYRRSMYTFWKRTSPPPQMQTFDAPDRETCIVNRERTNTPLQALVLMNDPTYVEASRILAERMMLEGGTTPEDRVRFAFRLSTARQPSEKETAMLVSLFQKQRERYTPQPEEALKLLSAGEFKRNEQLDLSELAAWTNVASTILNLDETITRG
ncbi:PSD1 and planctomycete cytochrome C domain-containing protein [Verrucomicrobiota bacterium sgz303538]